MKIRYLAKVTALVLSVAMAVPAAAQQALELDADEAYVHPHSGIVVPAEWGGLQRTRANAYRENALDVGITFESDEPYQVLSFYVFRNTNGSLPLWFSQAQSALLTQDAYDDPELLADPEAFALPGQVAASALRAIYEPGDDSAVRSTGVAMFAIGEWYVKVRASSLARSPDALEHWMDSAIAELGLPDHNATTAVPIENCPNRLRFRGRARDAETDAVESALSGLLGSLLGVAAAADDSNVETERPENWCRDSEFRPTQVLFRANGSEDSYLLAMGDNGNAFSVGRDNLSAILSEGDGDEEPAYAVRLIMAGRTVNYTSQDRLPRPRRVLELFEADSVTGSVVTWGDERAININSGAL